MKIIKHQRWSEDIAVRARAEAIFDDFQFESDMILSISDGP